MTDRVDISSMTDTEKADMYAEQVKDMNDRAPKGDQASGTTTTAH